MTTQPIGYYFQNDYNDQLGLLSEMAHGDLADLQIIVFRALAGCMGDRCEELGMYASAESLGSDDFFVHSAIKDAVRILNGFPSKDALNLARAIVDIMETAKVD